MDRELTDEEAKAIRSLERLAKKWPKSLMLFSWSGALHVMDHATVFDISGGTGHHEASITTISGIPNDGGDPDY